MAQYYSDGRLTSGILVIVLLPYGVQNYNHVFTTVFTCVGIGDRIGDGIGDGIGIITQSEEKIIVKTKSSEAESEAS